MDKIVICVCTNSVLTVNYTPLTYSIECFSIVLVSLVTESVRLVCVFDLPSAIPMSYWRKM